MTEYTDSQGLVRRTDTSTPCRCGRPDCEWTEAQDKERDMGEWAEKWGPTLYPDMYPDRANEPGSYDDATSHNLLPEDTVDWS